MPEVEPCPLHPRYKAKAKPTSKKPGCTCLKVYEAAKERRLMESGGYTAREVMRYILFYDEHIRPTPQRERLGVVKAIGKMLALGTTPEQIMTALQNYRDDPWRKSADPRLVKHMRSFFVAHIIQQWETPVQRKVLPFRKPVRGGELLEADLVPEIEKPSLNHFQKDTE